MRIAITFPGQGTQAAGMGKPWRDQRSWEIVEDAEASLDCKLSELLLNADAAELGDTYAAQLAVLTCSLLVWNAVGPTLLDEHEIVGFAGHSLGQVTSLIASGVLSRHDGMQFGEARARATRATALDHEGKMTALVGATLEQAEEACASTDQAWIANDNAPGQVVIAGNPASLECAVETAKQLGVRRAIPLAVSGAFHTPLMGDAVGPIREALTPVVLGSAIAPIVSNADAMAYPTSTGWYERLATHVTERVRWRESMLTLANDCKAEAFIELGHGGMISGVAKRTIPHVPVFGIATPDQAFGISDVLRRHQAAARSAR